MVSNQNYAEPKKCLNRLNFMKFYFKSFQMVFNSGSKSIKSVLKQCSKCIKWLLNGTNSGINGA